tara:strand:- start:2503 stop:3174 length:672 start_codon:yes stop_codon:yes gene_type:complete
MKLSILPGSLWIAYTMTTRGVADIATLIPEHTRLVQTKLLSSDGVSENPLLLFNAYKVASRWMNGNRIDIQTVVEDVDTGHQHLVILDVLTDTLDWNPVQGIRLPNTRFHTAVDHLNDTDAFRYEYHARSGRKVLKVNATADEKTDIDYRFAVEANLECFYRTFSTAYSMSFDHATIASPVRTLDPISVENAFWSDYRTPDVHRVFMHEHSMEFDVDVQNPFW